MWRNTHSHYKPNKPSFNTALEDKRLTIHFLEGKHNVQAPGKMQLITYVGNNYGLLIYSHQIFAPKCPTLTVYSLLEAFLVTRPETASPYLQFEQVYVN